jgi:hypothetical protein
MNQSRAFALSWAALLVLGCIGPAQAEVIQIFNLTDAIPGGTYQTGTTKITSFVGDRNGTVVNSIADATLSVGFDNPMIKGRVPATFATWGSPPDTESSTPAILNSFKQPNAAVRTLTFSLFVSVFGLEVEGQDFVPATFVMDFYSGGSLLDSITRIVDGDSGARILGGYSSVPFDRVVIKDELEDEGDSFAVAQVRYGGVVPAPEPATLLLLLTCFGGIALPARSLRRRRLARPHP